MVEVSDLAIWPTADFAPVDRQTLPIANPTNRQLEIGNFTGYIFDTTISDSAQPITPRMMPAIAMPRPPPSLLVLLICE